MQVRGPPSPGGWGAEGVEAAVRRVAAHAGGSAAGGGSKSGSGSLSHSVTQSLSHSVTQSLRRQPGLPLVV
eukprot:653104-Pyramimonas_sp.AAC.1